MGGYVTAGIPSLTPERRGSISALRAHREKSRLLLKDEIGRNENTVTSDGGINVCSSVEQMGRPMFATQITSRLRRCNSNLSFETSKADPSKVGIYLIENRDGKVEKRFICGMESGISPEFSIRHHKDTRVPDPDVPGHWQTVRTFDRETRGWRTILARLLRSGIITQPQIDQFFNPAVGRSSRNWQLLTT